MQSLTAAQSLAQRGSVSLARRAASIARSRALPLTTSSSTSSSSPRTASSLHSSASIPQWAAAPPLHTQCRCFSLTAVRSKKGAKKGGGDVSSSSKKKGKGGGGDSSASTPSAHDEEAGGGAGLPQPDPEDPFNWADVDARWDRSDAHYKERLQELARSLGGGGDGDGGVNVEAIGKTPVGGGKKTSEPAVPLSQLALIIPRSGGRVVELRMHSAESRKAIMSAVQANPYFRGQQPQPDPDDELVLLIRLGGDKAAAGASNPEEAAAERTRRVRDVTNGWRDQIRKATAKRQKTHQGWKKQGQVKAQDDLRRLDQDLFKLQEKRMSHIDEAEKKLLQQLQKAKR